MHFHKRSIEFPRLEKVLLANGAQDALYKSDVNHFQRDTIQLELEWHSEWLGQTNIFKWIMVFCPGWVCLVLALLASPLLWIISYKIVVPIVVLMMWAVTHFAFRSPYRKETNWIESPVKNFTEEWEILKRQGLPVYEQPLSSDLDYVVQWHPKSLRRFLLVALEQKDLEGTTYFLFTWEKPELSPKPLPAPCQQTPQ